jgi:lipopolysaccharide export system permease protein
MSLTKMPDLLLQVLPFAILLGTLVWLNQLNRRQELVALRASGLPARRFVLAPLLMCGLLGVTALLVVNPVAATMLKTPSRSCHPQELRATMSGLRARERPTVQCLMGPRSSSHAIYRRMRQAPRPPQATQWSSTRRRRFLVPFGSKGSCQCPRHR